MEQMPQIKPEIKAWFDYPDDPLGGRVLVRLLKAGEQKAIFARTREAEVQYVKEFRQPKTVFRMNGTQEALAVAAVQGWENFQDADGKDMKCTPENIRIMCMESGFLDFIDDCMAKLEEQAKIKAEESLKN